jgi:hypothetical protein
MTSGSERFGDIKFTHLLIDECSQAVTLAAGATETYVSGTSVYKYELILD